MTTDGRTHHAGCWRDHLDCAVREVERLRGVEAENRILRGAIQMNPDWKCPHGYAVDNIGKCPLGFPGCACADDRIAVYCEDEERIVSRLRAALAGHEQITALIEELWPQDGPYVVAEVLTRARAAQLPPELREEAREHAESLGYSSLASLRMKNLLRRIAAIGENNEGEDHGCTQ